MMNPPANLDPAATTDATREARPLRKLRAVVGVAFWAGLLAGLVELALIVARIQIGQNGLYRKSFHVLWMAPVADMLIVGIAGLLLGLLVWPIPKVGHRLGGFLLATLAILVPLLAINGLRAGACLILAAGLAAWIAPMARTHPAGLRCLVRGSTPILLLTLLGLAVFATRKDWMARHGPAPGGPAPAGAPNVLLVVMDTVRADATSLQGSTLDTTPNLEALARRGARFDRAIATAPWTLPSHASLFTGRWTWELGVGPDQPLGDRYPTLAEYLGQRGYDTAGFAANTTFCTAEYGLSRGFGHYEDYVLTPVEILRSSALGWLIARRAESILDRVNAALGRQGGHPLEGDSYRKSAAEIHQAALDWIATERDRDRPFFVFLNDFDAHDPYLLPDGARSRFSQTPPSIARRRLLREWVSETPRKRTPEATAIAREAYNDCLAYLDEQIGRLHDGLDRLGLLENTIIIITADHGEHFGEHARDGFPLVGHRLSVFQQEIHVPLLMIAPDRIPAGTVVPGAVSLRDLPATVVDLAGLRDGSPFPGHSLARFFGSDDDTVATPALAEFNPEIGLPVGLRYRNDAPGLMRAIVEGATAYHRHEGGHEELYDLETDPGEQHDIADHAEEPGALDHFRAWLDRLVPDRAQN